MAKLISDVSSQVQIVHLGKCSSRCWCYKHAYFFTIAGPRASQGWMDVYMGGMCPAAAQYCIAAVHRVSAGLRAMIVWPHRHLTGTSLGRAGIGA